MIIILMSDHGLPADESAIRMHSIAVKKLFDSKEPHITDFYDKLLELT